MSFYIADQCGAVFSTNYWQCFGPAESFTPYWLVVIVLEVLFLLLHEKVTINLAVMNPRSYTNEHL